MLAFLTSALEFAFGARLEIAWPRLTDPLPVIFALSSAKPPGMLKAGKLKANIRAVTTIKCLCFTDASREV